MPVFVREGAQIPMYPEHVECTDEMDLEKTVILNIDQNFKGYKI
jgi:alpha-D-xyloside xylohydrolase